MVGNTVSLSNIKVGVYTLTVSVGLAAIGVNACPVRILVSTKRNKNKVAFIKQCVIPVFSCFLISFCRNAILITCGACWPVEPVF